MSNMSNEADTQLGRRVNLLGLLEFAVFPGTNFTTCRYPASGGIAFYQNGDNVETGFAFEMFTDTNKHSFAFGTPARPVELFSITGISANLLFNGASLETTGGMVVGTTLTVANQINTAFVYASGYFDGDDAQLLGVRQPAIADAAGGAIIDVQARAQLNALLAALRIHGMIAT